MTRPAARPRLPHLAALLAVALLTFAGVRSVVMQAAMAAPPPALDCGMAAMDGMAAGGAHDPRSKPAKGEASCAFCAAAHPAPLAAGPPAPPAPSAVAWTPPAPRVALGPRGPPAFAPKARGPPTLLLT